MTNLLQNSGFEGGWTRQTHDGREFGEIFVPEGWTAYWREGGPVPHDPENDKGYGRPEVHVINREPPFLDPPRVRTGNRALKFFTFHRIHDAGVYQRADVAPGERYRAVGWAHAWSSIDDDPHTSNVDGDGARNVTFRVGIDPTGGTDPWADTVVWGDGAHLYNDYGQIPAVEVEARADAVTVFVRSSVLWPFKHCDAYVDDVSLEPVTSPTPPEEEPGEPYPWVLHGSKLHPHAISESGTYDMLKYLTAHGVTLPLFKVVVSQSHEFPAIRNLHQLMPEAAIIGRVLQDGAFNPQGWGPGVDLDAYMAHFIDYAAAYPEVTWWELWNEENPDDHVPMARAAIRCMDIAEAHGFRLALMSYSTGVPEASDWQAIWDQTDFFQRARAGGHILALHAYGRTTDDAELIHQLVRPSLELYQPLLIPNDCVVPYVFTEYSVPESAKGTGITDWQPSDLLWEYDWFEHVIAGQWYCLGASVYTFGQQDHYSHNALWRDVADLIVSVQDRENCPLPEPRPVRPPLPVTPYDKRYNVVEADLPLARRREIYDLCAQNQESVGPAATDAVAWAPELLDAGKRVTVVAWDRKPDEHGRWRNWAARIDPRIVVEFAGGPAHGGGTELWFTYPTTHHPAVITSPYGPRGSGFHHGVDLRSSWAAWRDELLAAIDGEVVLVGWEPGREYFGYQVQIRAVFAGDEVVVRYAHLIDGGAYVQVGDQVVRGQKIGRPDNTGQSTGDHLHFDVRVNGEYIDPTDMIDWPKETADLLLGFNDHTPGAGRWLADQGLPGLIVQPAFVGGIPIAFDASDWAAAGIRVIVNLRYSWSTDCGGAGTLPAPGSPEWQQFVAAAAQTIRDSTGVWGWELFNEVNNPREWPRNGSLTAADVIATYNAIRDRAGAGHRMAPGALDPFHASAGDPRAWLASIWDGIAGAEFVAAHGYVRGPDPDLVGSDARFADEPLTWQALNYPGCITRLIVALPTRYRSLPVYVTEFNHLWRTEEGDWGWVDDARAAEVVRRAFAAAQSAGLEGLALYRWIGDAWAMHDKAHILEAVRALST